MMGISDTVGEVLSIPEPSARFLIALYAAYPFSFAYRSVMADQHARAKNIFFTLTGLSIMYYVYGFNIWHSLVDVIAVYTLLVVCGGTVLSVALTWIITMGHLMYGYVHVAWLGQVHPIAWTIPQCVLVLKLIGLSWNIYDAKRDASKISADMKQNAISTIPSLLEVSGFCYFHGSVLAGPQLSFKRYRDFINGDLFDWRKTPSSIPTGLQRLMVGVFMSLIFSILNKYLPLSMLVEDNFDDNNMVTKLLLMFVCGKVALWRYIAVWMIAEGSCILSGISYNGIDREGHVDWHALANVHIINNETTVTLEGVIDTFNINTNQWIALYVFKRLKWLGNKGLSYVVALTFVSLWHGIWPGYALSFSFELICIMSERAFIKFLKRLIGCSLSDFSFPVRLPLTLLAYVLKNLILFYPVVQFMLLSWADCWKFMVSMYFFGHVVVLGWAVIYFVVIANLTRRPQKKVE